LSLFSAETSAHINHSLSFSCSLLLNFPATFLICETSQAASSKPIAESAVSECCTIFLKSVMAHWQMSKPARWEWHWYHMTYVWKIHTATHFWKQATPEVLCMMQNRMMVAMK
jgi:hypothetical protein